VRAAGVRAAERLGLDFVVEPTGLDPFAAAVSISVGGTVA
jgi:hypothetical protein